MLLTKWGTLNKTCFWPIKHTITLTQSRFRLVFNGCPYENFQKFWRQKVVKICTKKTPEFGSLTSKVITRILSVFSPTFEEIFTCFWAQINIFDWLWEVIWDFFSFLLMRYFKLQSKVLLYELFSVCSETLTRILCNCNWHLFTTCDCVTLLLLFCNNELGHMILFKVTDLLWGIRLQLL